MLYAPLSIDIIWRDAQEAIKDISPYETMLAWLARWTSGDQRHFGLDVLENTDSTSYVSVKDMSSVLCMSRLRSRVQMANVSTTAFGRAGWLNDAAINIAIEAVADEANRCRNGLTVATISSNLLASAFQIARSSPGADVRVLVDDHFGSARPLQRIRTLAQAGGCLVIAAFNPTGAHWLALKADSRNGPWSIGDPLRPDSATSPVIDATDAAVVRALLELAGITVTGARPASMRVGIDIAEQRDDHSCGPIVVNALAHSLLGVPLARPDDASRAQMQIATCCYITHVFASTARLRRGEDKVREVTDLLQECVIPISRCPRPHMAHHWSAGSKGSKSTGRTVRLFRSLAAADPVAHEAMQ